MIQSDQFLVCGLGSLGQQCVVMLKRFGVNVSAIDNIEHKVWEIEKLPDLLDMLLIGDCREPDILKKSKIEQYRCVILVTNDDRINIEAAFEARLKNPHIRLVLRSSKENLNQLLSYQIGNFVAFEPRELSAPAFVLAALGDKIHGYFTIEDQFTQVVKEHIQAKNPLCGKTLYEINNSLTRRVLSHIPRNAPLPRGFYQWKPDTAIKADDILTYVEMGDQSGMREEVHLESEDSQLSDFDQTGISEKIRLLCLMLCKKIFRFWRSNIRDQIRRMAMICAITVFSLLFCGGILFNFFVPDIGFGDALYATAVLLLGGYSDLLGSQLKFTIPIPWWLRLFGLALSIAGTVFVGVLYAFFTQNLISARFQFARRPPVPRQNHVVVIGLDMVGKHVISLLKDFQHSLVGIAKDEGQLSENIPFVSVKGNNMELALASANLNTAKSVIAVTNDEMDNLEIGLMAKRMKQNISLVIRTYNPRFSDNVSKLFPGAQVLCISALAAEAFAAAAFGEKVPYLFRLNEETILVTEYNIEANDTLNGFILSEISHGYGVVPILHQRPSQNSSHWMPADDTRLLIGDRLFVLATIEGLRRIEQGEMLPRFYSLLISKAPTEDARFEGANTIARFSGCDIGMAKAVMQNLPAKLPVPLFEHQGYNLVKLLRRNLVDAEIKVNTYS